MVRHNNMIPYGHFHKKWQRHVQQNLSQPFKKIRRNLRRARKLKSIAPRPADKLRPMIHCPTVRYHTKTRQGRGFTMQELKSVNINPAYARSIGIAVDRRRRNKSYESVLLNKSRLQVYMAKVVVFPKNCKKKIEDAAVVKRVGKDLKKIDEVRKCVKARVPSKEEKGFSAFATLRKARATSKQLRRKLRREKSNSDQLEVGK